MQWSDITFAPASRTLRQFAGLWLLFFAALATVEALEGRHGLALVLGGVALGVGLPGLVKPGLLRPVYVGAMLLAFPIGWTVSKLILACLFFGVFTPVALMFRLIGRDVLCLRPQPRKETFWATKTLPTGLDRYFRPF